MNTLVAAPMKPLRVVNFAKILPLFEPVTKTGLVPLSRQPQTIQFSGRADTTVQLVPRGTRALAPAKLDRTKPQTFSATKTGGTLSPINRTHSLTDQGVADLDLPFGMPRFVNAATLKKMFKAKRTDLLLRKKGSQWEICEDLTKIDLTDDSIEFRLGTVQIFS